MPIAAIGTANTVSLDLFGDIGRATTLFGVGALVSEPVMAQVDSMRGVDHTPLDLTKKLIGGLIFTVGGELLLRKGGGVDMAKTEGFILRDMANYAKLIDAIPDAAKKLTAQTEFEAKTGKKTADVIAAAVALKLIA